MGSEILNGREGEAAIGEGLLEECSKEDLESQEEIEGRVRWLLTAI